MKPDYEKMSKAELKAYVLQHREDIEAIRLLFTVPPDVEVKCYPPVVTEEGVPIPNNLHIMKQAIQEKIAEDNQRQDT